MSDYSVRDIVDFTLSNEPTKAKEAFNAVIIDKLKDAIEDKKIDVAAKFFGSPLEDEHDEQDEYDTEEPENG
jgi:hypothetical protein